MMKPDLSEVVLNSMPIVSERWMLACPMSRMNASYRASISVSDDVMPGLSSPEIFIWIISTLFSIESLKFNCRYKYSIFFTIFD